MKIRTRRLLRRASRRARLPLWAGALLLGSASAFVYADYQGKFPPQTVFGNSSPSVTRQGVPIPRGVYDLQLGTGLTKTLGTRNTGSQHITLSDQIFGQLWPLVKSANYSVAPEDSGALLIATAVIEYKLPNPSASTAGTTYQFGSDGANVYTVTTVGGTAILYGCAPSYTNALSVSLDPGIDLSVVDTGTAYKCTSNDNGTVTLRNLTDAEVWIGNALNLPIPRAISGDATLSRAGVLMLANTAVTPATYGDATHVGRFTVDAKGRLTAASSVAITGSGVTCAGCTTNTVPKTTGVGTLGDSYYLSSATSNYQTLSIDDTYGVRFGGSGANLGITFKSDTGVGGAWSNGMFSYQQPGVNDWIYANGVVGTETAVLNADNLYEEQVSGYDGSGFGRGASILYTATENWASNKHGTKISIKAGITGSSSPPATRLTFNGDGSVSIFGSITSTGFISAPYADLSKLAASGTGPGAGLLKLEVVAGTGAGTCKLIAYAGTSGTAVTIVDNVGASC